MITKGGGDIGLLSKNTKIMVLEGHHTALIVKAMQYTEETWPKRASAALSISQEARQLSFVITALKDLAIEVGKAAKKGGQQRTVAKKKMIHMDDEYSAEVLLVDDKKTLGWNDVRVKLTGARQRLIITAPEVRVYQLKDFLPLKELLTALGKDGKWTEFRTEKLGSKLCTFWKHQGLKCVQVQQIFKSMMGENMEEGLEWNEKSGVLAEFDMTDNQVSLATQMAQQERTLFWERQKKSDNYTALIKKAEGGEMRADAFQEIVSCESDNAFKSCFANQSSGRMARSGMRCMQT